MTLMTHECLKKFHQHLMTLHYLMNHQYLLNLHYLHYPMNL
jgi:hypothetical protein